MWSTWLIKWCSTPLSTIFSHIVAVIFIGGGNQSSQRKPPTWHMSLTTLSHKVVLSTWARFELTTLVVIGTYYKRSRLPLVIKMFPKSLNMLHRMWPFSWSPPSHFLYIHVYMFNLVKIKNLATIGSPKFVTDTC